MNRFIRRSALSLLLAGASIAVTAAAGAPSFAAEEGEPDTEVSREVADLYNDAAEAFQEDMDIPAAHGILAQARALPDKTPYETYLIEKLDLQLYLQQNDLVNARLRMDAAFDSGRMPAEDKALFLRSAMLLSYNEQDYARAVMYGEQAQNNPDWDDQADQVLGLSYYHSGNVPMTEQFAQSVIARKQAAGQQPTPEVLQILLNVQQELMKDAEARETLGMLAVVQPTPENWGRVVDTAFLSEGVSDRQYLNLYRLRRKAAGALAPTEYGSVANEAFDAGLFAEAKEIIEEGIAGGHLTASELGQAMTDVNNAAAELEGQLPEFAAAADTAATGDADVLYGETLYTLDRHAEAEAAIRRGIMKGGMADPSAAQILLGIVLLEQGKKEEAVQVFQQVEQSGSTAVRPVAWAWRLYASI